MRVSECARGGAESLVIVVIVVIGHWSLVIGHWSLWSLVIVGIAANPFACTLALALTMRCCICPVQVYNTSIAIDLAAIVGSFPRR